MVRLYVFLAILFVLVVQSTSAFTFSQPTASTAYFKHEKINHWHEKINHRVPKVPEVNRGGALHALPTCAASDVVSLAVKAGVTCLSAQIVLQSFFKRSKDPLLNRGPGHLAHTVVALPLMVFVSYIGTIGYWFNNAPKVTAVDKIMTISDESRALGAVLCGIMAIWDVPTSFSVKTLRSPDILIHHAILSVVSFIVATSMPCYYCFFYFGVVELISPPLAIYDQLEKTCEIADSIKDPRLGKLRKVRDRFQLLSGIVFTLTRAYLFTKVTWFNFIPDMLSVMKLPTAKPLMKTLRISVVAAVGFSILQLVWFEQMISVVTGRRKDDRVNV